MTSPLAAVWAGALAKHANSGIVPDVAYQRDIIGWAEYRLAIPRHTLVWSLNPGYDTYRWDGTPDPMLAIARALENWDDVGVESATGTGKSFFAAVCLLWFLACWENARVFTFAVTEKQLKRYIWMEVRKLFPAFKRAFPTAELTDLALRMRGGIDGSWGAEGVAVAIKAGQESAVGAQGMHAPHMLLIGEEWAGAPRPVLEAHENTCTAPHNIRLYVGNPDNQQDALHTVCTTPGVIGIRVSAFDHPNVVADDATIIEGAVSRRSIERRRRKYVSDDHPMFQSRVRGISPPEAQNALIKSSWVRAAFARAHETRFRVGGKALGVDVANSESGDLGAVARGIGAYLSEVAAKPVPDSNVFGAEVVTEARANGIQPQHVGIDSVGVGAGSVNEAKRLGFRVTALNGGARADTTMDAAIDLEDGEKAVSNVEKFHNLRAQMHWQFADDLQFGRIAIEPDEELLNDLIAPTWETRNGKILVEPKEDIRTRLGRSPNKGDAAIYWNWVRPRVPLKDDPDAHEISAFDPEVLQRAAEESRKLKPRLERRRKGIRQIIDSGDY